MMDGASSQSALWRSLLLGLLAGAGGVVIVAIVLFTFAVLGAVPLLLLVAMGFGGMGRTVLVLAAALVVAVAALWIALWAWKRFAGRRLFKPGRSPLEWTAISVGALLGVAAAAVLMPPFVKDQASRHLTGEPLAAHAPLPATDAERRRMSERVRPAALAGDPAAQVELGLALQYGAAGESRDLDAAATWIKRAAEHPEGFEARILIAVSRKAAPVPRGGRIVTDEDTALKVSALRHLATELPHDWQPMLLGTIGGQQQTHYGNTHANDQPMRDTLVEAGRAGSRAYAVHAAAMDEAVATEAERSDETDQADKFWRRAQQGYAEAGAVFEVERLRIETIPERLVAFPDPPPAKAWPAADAALAQRFWRLAWALNGDEVRDRAPPDYQSLAASAALQAMERAPGPAWIALLGPANGWAKDPWALSRHLLALRHARGECSAAIELSNAIRHRRKTGFSNITPKVSMHDMAWALAWAEVGERCAATDESRQHAGERRQALVAMYINAKELDQARAGVAATIAALR